MVNSKISDAEYEAKIISNVEKFGCHVTTVFDPEGVEPSFTYSIGFTRSIGQGEVIVFGLSSNLMGFMINETLRQCRDGLRLAEGVRISGLLEDFDVVVRSIPQANITREHFNSALWFHRREFGTELEDAFQLVWPGAREGLFPWDDGSSCDAQPALYEIGSVH